MNAHDLRLVYGCPKWCTEDHTVQAGEDREHHAGRVRELRLPDGHLVLEASLTVEPGRPVPQLVVAGSLDLVVDDVQLLDLDSAQLFANDLQRFASHVQQMTATLRTAAASVPRRKKTKPGKSIRSGWHETRLYLAERDGRRCFYCRTEFDALRGVTIDHYVPKSVWACHLPANLVLACADCNHAKGDRLTWSMAAVLLAWAREGGAARDDNTVPRRAPATATRSSLASLAG